MTINVTIPGSTFGSPYGVGISEKTQITKYLTDNTDWYLKPLWNTITGGKMRNQLFRTAVLYHTKKKTTLVVPDNVVLAESEEKARIATIKDIPATYKERFDRLEVVVRPF